MPFPEFDPVLISIGPFPLRWYALAYIAGLGLGWWYASKLAKTISIWSPGRPPVTQTQLDDLVLLLPRQCTGDHQPYMSLELPLAELAMESPPQ